MVEAFKFLFHMSEELGFRPYEQGLARLRLPANRGTEFGILRGQTIKVSRKAAGLTDGRIG
ncbi:MAG: hypothetical protein WCG29_11915 [Desulfomonile sp.]|nr:hypothetical protein [Deltaproteobacteria bacterium]